MPRSFHALTRYLLVIEAIACDCADDPVELDVEVLVLGEVVELVPPDVAGGHDGESFEIKHRIPNQDEPPTHFESPASPLDAISIELAIPSSTRDALVFFMLVPFPNL